MQPIPKGANLDLTDKDMEDFLVEFFTEVFDKKNEEEISNTRKQVSGMMTIENRLQIIKDSL